MPENMWNADSVTGSNSSVVVQFNLVSQLPIKVVCSHNFSTQKAKISMLIRGHNLFGHLDGSSSAPSTTLTQYSRQVANPKYSICLHDQLARLSKDTRSVADYLHQVCSICNELATAGAIVTNDELVVKILSGLGSDFHDISAVIRARDSIISYDELYAKLIDYEIFLKHEELKKETSAVTAAMLCNKQSHTANGYRSQSHNHLEAKANFLSGNQAAENQWIVDSGATHHVTTEPTNFKEYHGSKGIDMGDGLENAGSTSLRGNRNGLYEWPNFTVNNSTVRVVTTAVPRQVWGEYKSLDPYLNSNGIEHLVSPPHTPQRVSIAEHRDQHIVETAKTLLHEASLSANFWSFACQHAAYLINRLPTQLLNNTSPYENNPNLLSLHIIQPPILSPTIVEKNVNSATWFYNTTNKFFPPLLFPPFPPTRSTTRSRNNIFCPKRPFNYLVQLPVVVAPHTFRQALKHPEWRLAMKDQFDALIRNQTWELVPRGPNKNVVDCKWIYRIRKKAEVKLNWYSLSGQVLITTALLAQLSSLRPFVLFFRL
ncbi:uncharacterized protein LOC124886658 [Capsicum annuum]|uniref:uncharacterized protein LOC124886658 n=1 Tax=Capsicum annuum TaxID=4072 RepID=UPI001FB09878|nr:uncharacterized protein LOC124886658 [Capsicum annuum]